METINTWREVLIAEIIVLSLALPPQYVTQNQQQQNLRLRKQFSNLSIELFIFSQ